MFFYRQFLFSIIENNYDIDDKSKIRKKQHTRNSGPPWNTQPRRTCRRQNSLCLSRGWQVFEWNMKNFWFRISFAGRTSSMSSSCNRANLYTSWRQFQGPHALLSIVQRRHRRQWCGLRRASNLKKPWLWNRKAGEGIGNRILVHFFIFLRCVF